MEQNLYEKYYGKQWEHWVNKRKQNDLKADIIIVSIVLSVAIIGVKLLFF